MEKVYTKEEENKIQWHQAFVGAMYCEKVYEKWCSGRVVQQYRENERKDRDITVTCSLSGKQGLRYYRKAARYQYGFWKPIF